MTRVGTNKRAAVKSYQNNVLKLRLSALRSQKYKFKEYRDPSVKIISNQYPNIKLTSALKRLDFSAKVVVTDDALQQCAKSLMKLKERLSKLSWNKKKNGIFDLNCNDCNIKFSVQEEYVKNLKTLKRILSQIKFWNEDDPDKCQISIRKSINHKSEHAERINKSAKFKVAKENEESHNVNFRTNAVTNIQGQCNNVGKQLTNKDKSVIEVEVHREGEEKQVRSKFETVIKSKFQCENLERKVTRNKELDNETTITLDETDGCKKNEERSKPINVPSAINVDCFASNIDENCTPNEKEGIFTHFPHPSIQKLLSVHKNVVFPKEVLNSNVTPVVALNRMDLFNWYENEVDKLRKLVKNVNKNLKEVHPEDSELDSRESLSLLSSCNVIELENRDNNLEEFEPEQSLSKNDLNKNSSTADISKFNNNNSDILKRPLINENDESNSYCSKKIKLTISPLCRTRQPLLTQWFKKLDSPQIQQQKSIKLNQNSIVLPQIVSKQIPQQSVRSQEVTQQSLIPPTLGEQTNSKHQHQEMLQQQISSKFHCLKSQKNIQHQRQPQLQQHQLQPQVQQHQLRPQVQQHQLRPQVQQHQLRTQVQQHQLRPQVQQHQLRPQVQQHQLQPQLQQLQLQLKRQSQLQLQRQSQVQHQRQPQLQQQPRLPQLQKQQMPQLLQLQRLSQLQIQRLPQLQIQRLPQLQIQRLSQFQQQQPQFQQQHTVRALQVPRSQVQQLRQQPLNSIKLVAKRLIYSPVNQNTQIAVPNLPSSNVVLPDNQNNSNNHQQPVNLTQNVIQTKNNICNTNSSIQPNERRSGNHYLTTKPIEDILEKGNYYTPKKFKKTQ